LGLFSVIPDKEVNDFSWQGVLKPPVLKHIEKALRTARKTLAHSMILRFYDARYACTALLTLTPSTCSVAEAAGSQAGFKLHSSGSATLPSSSTEL